MNALANQHTSVAAAKLLGKLFRSTSCPPTPPELQVLTAFMHQLPQLLNLYLQAVAAGEQGVTICLALSRMINKISSAQLELVAACQLPHTPVMGQLALAGTAHPADAVASTAAEFWHELAEIPTDERDPSMCAPVYAQLLMTLVERCAFPPDFTCWSDSILDEDEFVRFREYSALETLEVAGHLLGADAFDQLFGVVRSSTDKWHAVEAALFGISSLVRCAEPANQRTNEVLDAIFNFLLSLPATNPLLSIAIAKLLSRYAKWLCARDAMLANASRYLVEGLQSDTLAAQPDVAEAFASSLLQLSRNVLAHSPPSHVAAVRLLLLQLSGGALVRVSYAARGSILEACSLVLASAPQVELQSAVQILAEPILGRLQAGGSLVAEEVQLLAALTRFLEGPEAALIVAQLWLTVLPLAQQVLAALPAGSKLLMATLGALCAALSRSLELTRGALSQSLPMMVSIAVPYFQTTRAACCQSMLSKAVDVFGAEISFVDQFRQLLDTMATTVYSTVTAALDEEILAEHFALLYQFAAQCPDALLPTPSLANSIE